MTITGQFKGGQIRIPKVTGNVIINVTATNDTSPPIKAYGKGYSPLGTIRDDANGVITERMKFGKKVLSTDANYKIYTYLPYTSGKGVGVGTQNNKIFRYLNGIYVGYSSVSMPVITNGVTINYITPASSFGDYDELAFTLSKDNYEDSFAYTQDGYVIFAGVNTPYYGKKNIGD